MLRARFGITTKTPYTRRAHCVAWVALAATLGWYAAQFAHGMHQIHVLCAQHGLVDAGDTSSGATHHHPHHATQLSNPENTTHTHAPCDVWTGRREALEAGAGEACDRSDHFRFVRNRIDASAHADAVALLRLAPKVSPPRMV